MARPLGSGRREPEFVSPDRASAHSLLARYRRCGPRERFHVHLRSRMMKLWLLEREVPKGGRVLDLGCGQGLVALALALAGPERDVVGVEREERKVQAARMAGEGVENLSFRKADILELDEEGSFDVALLADVLYLWDGQGKGRILRNAWRALRRGGLLLVQEVVTRPRIKYWFALLQEWVTLRLLRTTPASGIWYASREENEALLRSCGFEVESVPFHRGMPYPHFLFRCRKV